MKTAIIGAGRMGRRHIAAAQALNHNIIGVVDISPENLALASKENGIAQEKLFTSAALFFKDNSPDIILVATTADSHHDYVMKLAAAGVKYILCEKPMAISVSQCEEMIEACAKSGTRLAINHPVRFTEADIEIKKLLESDRFGGCQSITITAGNFGLAMNATHNIEMFKFVTGEKPRYVQAWLDAELVPNPRGIQFEDRSGFLKVESASGKRLIVNATAAQGHGVFINYAARYGQISLDLLTGEAHLSYRKLEHRAELTTQYAKPFEIENIKLVSSDLTIRTKKVLQALVEGNDYPSGESVLDTIKTMAAAYISHENGNKLVDIENDELPAGRKFPWA